MKFSDIVAKIDTGEIECPSWEPAPVTSVAGNAYVQMARWENAAKLAGWDKAQIEAVVEFATRGDYDTLLATLVIASDA